MNLDLYFLADL